MSLRRLKEKGLRIKLFFFSALTVAGSLYLISFLMNDDIGRTMMHDDGWPLLAMLVAIAVIGFGLMFYLATPAKPAPLDTQDKGQENQQEHEPRSRRGAGKRNL